MRAINLSKLLITIFPQIKTNKSFSSSAVVNIMSGAEQTAPGFNRPRLVAKKVLAKAQLEGDGAVVRRSIGRFSFILLLLPFFDFSTYVSSMLLFS